MNRRKFVSTAAAAGLASMLRAEAHASSEGKPVRTQGLHHIGIFATDPKATIQFFTEGLGFTTRYKWSVATGTNQERSYDFGLPCALLDSGDGNYIEILPRPPGTENQSPVFPLNHFALRTDDIEKSYQLARSHGANTYTISLPDGDWDGTPLDFAMEGEPPIQAKIAFVKGPDDIVIEFFENAIL